MKILISLIISMITVNAVEPDFIKTTMFNVDNNGNNLVSTVYSGMGREVQSKFRINSGKDRVISTFYDKLNRKKITTKPYIDTVYEGSFLPGDFNSVNSFLKETYGDFDTLDGDPYAYSEVQYFSDQSGRVKVTGSPGVNNRIGSGNENRSWYFSIAKHNLSITLPQGTVLFNSGMIKNVIINSGFDTVALFDSLYGFLLESSFVFSPRTHFLTIAMDPLGNYSQKLDDELGRTITSWSDPDTSANDEIIARTRYDFYGNPLEEIAPVNLLDVSDTVLIQNSKYLYNTLGNVIRKETPDGAIDTFIYEKSGKITSIKSWSVNTLRGLRELYEQTDFVYDKFGRQIRIIKTRKNKLVTLTDNYYDNTDGLKKEESSYNIPPGILNQLTNLCNKLVCSVAHNIVDNKSYQVIDLFAYNDEGEISKKFKMVPGIPIQEINYDYDIHGKTSSEKIICGSDTIIKHYSYDPYGRVQRITHQNNGGKELVKFTYNDLGKTTVKTLDSIHDVGYDYSIQDQIKKIQSNGPMGFKENISYLENSNIDSVKCVYNGTSPDSFFNAYRYDKVNRLISVSSSKPENNSGYSYDQAGRFKAKQEGSTAISGYSYHQKTNRLKYAKDSIRDYVYDQRGNLIVDRFKNLVITYNGDNLPVLFKFYKSIPSTVTSDERGTAVISDTTFTGNIYQYMDKISSTDLNCRMISRVTMIYDASGNRVLKMENIQ